MNQIFFLCRLTATHLTATLLTYLLSWIHKTALPIKRDQEHTKKSAGTTVPVHAHNYK